MVNDLPQPNVTLDDPSGTIYVFAPASKHTNTLVVNVANPLLTSLPNGPNARIVLTFQTSDAGDASALTSAALAQAIVPKVAAFDDNWTYDHQQQGARHTVELKPQGSVIVDGNHAIISIALSNLVTCLPAGLVALHVAVRDFPGLDDADVNLVLHRSAYPLPIVQLWTNGDEPLPLGSPMSIGWNVQFADTLTVRYTNGGVTPDRSYSLAAGQISLAENDFVLWDKALLSGSIEVVATNDSNPEEIKTVDQNVAVQRPDKVTISSSVDYEQDPPVCSCTIDPPVLLGSAPWSFFSAGNAIDGWLFKSTVTVQFAEGVLPPTAVEYNSWTGSMYPQPSGKPGGNDTIFPNQDTATQQGPEKVQTYTGGDAHQTWSATFDTSSGHLVQSSVLTLIDPMPKLIGSDETLTPIDG